MNGHLSTNDPMVVRAFHAALLHQGFVVLAILAALAVAWNVLRSVQLRRAATGAGATPRQYPFSEPSARRLLRIGFGLLWIFDGILQGQASMPLGMVPGAVQPTAAASPSWVQDVVHWGTRIWSYHPVGAATAAVWIQVGIGLWLLAAPRGDWSRLGGLLSAGWGLIVWVFGESFGGIFAPGVSWLFGAPGAVLFYVAVGVLITLPERLWQGARLGRTVLRALGAFLVGMAILQAWPGRGFWQGQAGPKGTAGSLTSMVGQMAGTPQPHLFASLVSDFTAFDAAHGWAVNLFVVVALAAIGAALLAGRERVGLPALAMLCLADWVFVEDLGFFGGVGTDPNSMIPMLLVAVAGYLAVARPPVAADRTVVALAPAVGWKANLVADPAYTLRALSALGAAGIVLLGVAPMAAAAVNRQADPILAEALDGAPVPFDTPAAPFQLVDQTGRPVTLAGLRGRTVALTFLDDVCTSDCPVIAREFAAADSDLGSAGERVTLVAINANPQFTSPDYVAAFDRQEGMDRVANWHFLTGDLAELKKVWAAYGEAVDYLPGGAMINHNEFAWVIDPSGRIRYVIDTDPGTSTAATRSSFSEVLAGAIRSVARSS